MKRNLECRDCAKRWVDAPRYDGEHVKAVAGVVRATSRSLICDGCASPLEPGAAAVAISVSTERTPYFAWEEDYLEDPAVLRDDAARAQ